VFVHYFRRKINKYASKWTSCPFVFTFDIPWRYILSNTNIVVGIYIYKYILYGYLQIKNKIYIL